MQKPIENQFLDKFHLLNSQEHNEEIIWSLSESSDYEETSVNEKFNNIINNTRILKRKRKKKALNNLSNLSITVLNAPKGSKELQHGETSPILVSKRHKKTDHQSPILPTQTCKLNYSPVLPIRSHEKSPILAPKINSPKTVVNIKKKLFQQNSDHGISDNITVKTELDTDFAIDDNLTSSISQLSENTSKAKSELVSKVKSFFDNHFSSESSSQNSQSISDIQTQRNSTRTSDEVEILTCKTQTTSTNKVLNTTEQEKSDHSSENYYTFNQSKKKNRYKKDGLAYRLDNILRKKNACLSLWHHERFLAANSNFIIPKGENTVFRIQKVHFKYGCYLLEAVDLNEEDYLVLINGCYVSESILCDTIIKVYEPFKIVQYNENTKLLMNVCRFECSHYKA